jgi:hypothetical protein
MLVYVEIYLHYYHESVTTGPICLIRRVDLMVTEHTNRFGRDIEACDIEDVRENAGEACHGLERLWQSRGTLTICRVYADSKPPKIGL